MQKRMHLLRSAHDTKDWGDAVSAAASLDLSASELLRTTIHQVRTEGTSWQVIGDALGVTRQAAFQRFGKPLDPRTGEPMNTTPLADAPRIARTVLDDLAAGAWPAVTARFDPAMAEALSDDGLGDVWAQILSQIGALESCGTPLSARAGALTVTNTPLEFEAGELTARITFRDDRTIAGLYFLDPQSS